MARLQLVVEVVRDSGFGYFDDIQAEQVYLPFCWMEEGMVSPSKVGGPQMCTTSPSS